MRSSRSRPARELCPARARIRPVDRQLFQADQTFSDQRCQALGQHLVQQRTTVAAELREHVVIGRNPAGKPAIRGVVFAQPFDGARRTDAVQRSIQPQRQQHRRLRRRAPRQIVAGFDAGVQFAQIQRLDERPDQTSPMIRRQLAIQIDRVPTQLHTVWQQQANAQAHRESLSASGAANPKSGRRGIRKLRCGTKKRAEGIGLQPRRPGHPRLVLPEQRQTWMAGPSPAMTVGQGRHQGAIPDGEIAASPTLLAMTAYRVSPGLPAGTA